MIEDRQRLNPIPKRTGRRRRPGSLRGPKLVAYCCVCGSRFGPTPVAPWLKPFLEYGTRPVTLRRFPHRKEQYYKFVSGAADGAVSRGMTRTHRVMQAIICDTGFVQCRIDGQVFFAYLDEPTPERTRPGDIASGIGVRRPDITARCRSSSRATLGHGPLDVEIAVTNPVADFDRYLDLIKSGRPCLEVLVPRSEELERDVDALDKHLRSRILGAEFEGRWIVGPDGAVGAMDELADIEAEFSAELDAAQNEVRRLSAEIREHEHARARASSDLNPLEGQRKLLDDYARANAEFGELARTLDAAHPERPSLFRKLVEVIIPELRTERLQTHAQRIAFIKGQLDTNAYRRSGLAKRMNALLRAEERAKAVAVETRDLEQQIALKDGMRTEQQGRVDDLAAVLRVIAALRKRGLQTIFRPDGHTVRDILAFEYDRWC